MIDIYNKENNAVSRVAYCTYQFNAATLQEGCHLALCCDECKMSSPSFICSIWQLSCLTNMAHVYLFYLNIIWWLKAIERKTFITLTTECTYCLILFRWILKSEWFIPVSVLCKQPVCLYIFFTYVLFHNL